MRSRFLGLDYWETSVVYLSTEGSLWFTYSFSLISITLPSVKNKTALLSFDLMSGICEQQFSAVFLLLSRDCSSVLLILYFWLFELSRET